MTGDKKMERAWHTTAEIFNKARDLLTGREFSFDAQKEMKEERWLSSKRAGALANQLTKAIYNNSAKFDMKAIAEAIRVLRGADDNE